MAYYNEFDPYAAQWLRNLIAEGLIADGHVDERSIAEVSADDLAGYRQCHFFAGIGGWSLALRLAGWPDDRPVWTGSCPCQPFSAAGKQRGTDDERHLWPEFRRLIAQCRPASVFGEQVASKAGRDWLAAVRADLEELAYGVGAADLCAAGVGAPHIRQRLWFVGMADADEQGSGRWGIQESGQSDGARAWPARERPEGFRADGGLADAERQRVRPSGPGGPGSAPSSLQGINGQRKRVRLDAGTGDDGLSARAGAIHGGWGSADWLFCRDGKWRPVEPGSKPLVDGLPGRVGQLRGYGNAIVPQVAAEFIGAVMECMPTNPPTNGNASAIGARCAT